MAADQKVEGYLQAWRDYSAAKTQIDKWGLLLQETSAALLIKPHQMSFASFSANLPPSSMTVIINGAQSWPDPKQIIQALEKMHAALVQLLQGWNRIPDSQRVGLMPPPEAAIDSSPKRR